MKLQQRYGIAIPKNWIRESSELKKLQKCHTYWIRYYKCIRVNETSL